jgi:hypothetical protein
MMIEEAKIEFVSKALCMVDGILPDTLIHRGLPLTVRGTFGYAARPIADALPYWQLKRDEAVAAILAIEQFNQLPTNPNQSNQQ